MDILKFKPRSDLVVVLDDQRIEKTTSGIYLPGYETGAEKVREGSGTVISVGSGKKIKALEIFPGDRVLYRGFLKYANGIETDEKWEDGTHKKYFLIVIDDILGVIAEGVEVGVYSGRPEVPTTGRNK